MIFLILFIFFIAPIHVQAFQPALPSLTQDDLDDIFKELGANFSHTSMYSARPVNTPFGFELGAMTGLTKSPKIQALITKTGSSFNLSHLPHGGAFAAISIPWGFTFDYLKLPITNTDNMDLEVDSGSIKWTFSMLFNRKKFLGGSERNIYIWNRPKFGELSAGFFDLAIRAHFSTSKLSVRQNINNTSTGGANVNAAVVFEQKVRGASFMVGTQLFFVEPYVGFGFVNVKGVSSIVAGGNLTATLFDAGFTTSDIQHAESDASSGHFIGGVQINLWVFRVGFEYQNLFGKDKGTIKLSLAL